VIREENNWGQYMSTEPLLVDQTEAYLQGMLDHAGITPDTLNPYKTWNTFKDFARIPVVCADDGLLFEVLPYPKDQFSLHFVRQFGLEEDGEYVGMKQLDCRFIYKLDDILARLKKVS
jgi:hypothetical protein